MSCPIILGYRKFDYTSKKTGRTYPAISLFVSEQRKGVVGVASFELFMPADCLTNPEQLSVGQSIFVAYNRFGSVEEASVVAPSAD